jgi:hypothetical protein
MPNARSPDQPTHNGPPRCWSPRPAAAGQLAGVAGRDDHQHAGSASAMTLIPPPPPDGLAPTPLERFLLDPWDMLADLARQAASNATAGGCACWPWRPGSRC